MLTTFAAIPVPREIAEALSAHIATLPPSIQPHHLTDLHITLCHWGADCPSAEREKKLQSLREHAPSPFEITTQQNFEIWHARGQSALVLPLQECPSLQTWLTACDETRTPHITLAYLTSEQAEAISSLPALETPFSWRANIWACYAPSALPAQRYNMIEAFALS